MVKVGCPPGWEKKEGECIPKTVSGNTQLWNGIKKICSKRSGGRPYIYDACIDLFSKEPRIDFIHTILGFHPNFYRVERTSEGFFLGCADGEIGANHFLGSPSDIAISRTKNLFPKLEPATKKYILSYLQINNIPADSLGITGDI